MRSNNTVNHEECNGTVVLGGCFLISHGLWSCQSSRVGWVQLGKMKKGTIDQIYEAVRTRINVVCQINDFFQRISPHHNFNKESSRHHPVICRRSRRKERAEKEKEQEGEAVGARTHSTAHHTTAQHAAAYMLVSCTRYVTLPTLSKVPNLHLHHII